MWRATNNVKGYHSSLLGVREVMLVWYCSPVVSLSAQRFASENYYVVVKLSVALLASPILGSIAFPRTSMIAGPFIKSNMLRMESVY